VTVGAALRLPAAAPASMVAAAAVAAGLAGCGGGSSPARSSTAQTATTHEAARVIGTPSARGSTARYGKIPSWLPKAKVPVGRVVTATPSHPAYPVEGDTVEVRLPTGRARVTAVGPRVPPHGSPPPPSTHARFVMTFAARHGTIPLRQGAFGFRDEHDNLHRAHVHLLGDDGALPTHLSTGRRPVSLVITGVLPDGDGALQWKPVGGQPTVLWDFHIELD
jgi:hypothetical protein